MAIGIAAVAGALHVAALAGAIEGALHGAAAALAATLAAALSTGACLAAARRPAGPRRGAWLLLAALPPAWLAAATAAEAPGAVPAALAALFPAALASLALFLWRLPPRDAGPPVRERADLGMIAAGAAIGAAVLFAPALRESPLDTTAIVLVSAAPALYAAAIGRGLLALWTAARGPGHAVLAASLGGIAALAAGAVLQALDLLRGADGTVLGRLDTGPLVGFALLYLASRRQKRTAGETPADAATAETAPADRRHSAREGSGNVRTLIPGLAALPLAAALGWHPHGVEAVVTPIVLAAGMVYGGSLMVRCWWDRRTQRALERENRATTDALAARAAAHQSILENMSDIVYRTDREGRLTALHGDSHGLIGYMPDELLGRPVADFYVDQNQRLAFLEQIAVQGGRIRDFEALLRHKGGQAVWVSTNARYFRDTAGNVLGIEGTTRDVTARRHAEDELRKLTRAVEQSPAGIMITDTTGRIEYVNPRFAQMSGYTPSEAIGRDPSLLKSDATPRDTYRSLWSTVLADAEWSGEILNRRKDGTLYWCRENISPIRDPDGRITHFLAIQEDITEQRRMEEERRQSQKMEAVGQLTGGVAHEFNNLLSVILGNIELLEERLEPGSREMRHARSAHRGASHAAELTRRLLAFSRPQPLAREPVDLRVLADDVAALMHRTLGPSLTIRIDAEPGLWIVATDRGQAESALLNLLLNARDAMRGAGTIAITLRNRTLAPEDVAGRPGRPTPGDYVALAVSDTGEGMTDAVRARAFEPFFTTKPVGRGTGLGLPMVYGFARQSGGFAELESAVGAGTTVAVYLPRSRATSDEAQQTNATVAARERRNVLVVEDDAAVRDVAVEMLEELGYAAITAEDAAAASRLLDAAAVDLVFSDVVMPGEMSGADLARHLAAARPDLPVLLTSGYGGPRDEPVPDGVGFVRKPYTKAELSRAVAALLADRPAAGGPPDGAPVTP